MSLSDHLKLLRARKGGVGPMEIEAATGVTAHAINYIEIKHRRVGEDDEMLGKLAAYFGTTLEELQHHREHFRKKLTAALYIHQDSGEPITLKLESGHELSGVVDWFDRTAIALRDVAEPHIVERHAVVDWRLPHQGLGIRQTEGAH